jgi:integrase
MPDRKRTSLGLFATREEAEETLIAARLLARERRYTGNDSFADFGRRVLDLRECDGVRGIRQERSRFRAHLEESSIAPRPVADIRTADIVALTRAIGRKAADDGREARKLSRHTVARCLSLASAIFDEAIRQDLRSDNPAKGVRLRKEARTQEPWDYLRLEEQRAIATCADVPLWARLMMGFAWGTGLRQGEQWNLERRDLHTEGDDPYVVVRFGSKGHAPKNGRIRRVPLFGDGLAAAKRWLQVLPGYAPKNPVGLVFPTVTGCRRGVGAPERGETNAEMAARRATKRGKVELLPEWLRQAGVTREVRWHDLRHTCASSLVAGWWGRTWTLQEVCEMLGHSSIVVTQRYAHLGETSLRRAGRDTPGENSCPL